LASSRHAGAYRGVRLASRSSPAWPAAKIRNLANQPKPNTIVAITANHAFQMAKNKKPGDTWSLKTE
jgi:hypothetical protein